jgi:hypothetical protein
MFGLAKYKLSSSWRARTPSPPPSERAHFACVCVRESKSSKSHSDVGAILWALRPLAIHERLHWRRRRAAVVVVAAAAPCSESGGIVYRISASRSQEEVITHFGASRPAGTLWRMQPFITCAAGRRQWPVARSRPLSPLVTLHHFDTFDLAAAGATGVQRGRLPSRKNRACARRSERPEKERPARRQPAGRPANSATGGIFGEPSETGLLAQFRALSHYSLVGACHCGTAPGRSPPPPRRCSQRVLAFQEEGNHFYDHYYYHHLAGVPLLLLFSADGVLVRPPASGAILIRFGAPFNSDAKRLALVAETLALVYHRATVAHLRASPAGLGRHCLGPLPGLVAGRLVVGLPARVLRAMVAARRQAAAGTHSGRRRQLR